MSSVGNTISNTDVLTTSVNDKFSLSQEQRQRPEDAAINNNNNEEDQCHEDERGVLDVVEEDVICGDALEQSSSSVIMSPDHQCLATVIASLVDRGYAGLVPYSHCMLTQLLKEGLGGNCLTLLVVCASPTRLHLPATSLAMKYGGLARYIINKPVINELEIPSEQDQLIWSINAATSRADEDTTLNSTLQSNDTPNASNTPANVAALDNKNPLETEELFRLQFAGWQLQQLVEGADSLLRTSLPFLPPALQAQVGAWLCRRNETLHCLGQQQQQTWPQRDERTLHVIEEVSEPGDLKNSRASESNDGRSSQSSSSSLGEEFYEQLAVLTSQFTDGTGSLVQVIQDKVDTFSDQSSEDEALLCDSEKSVHESSEEKMDSEREHCTDDAKTNSISVNAMNSSLIKSDVVIKEDEMNAVNIQTTYVNQIISDFTKKEQTLLEVNTTNSNQASPGDPPLVAASVSDDSDADMDTCESDADDSCSSEDFTGVQQPSAEPQTTAPVSAVALHVHEANRRKLRELRETIREKESHLRTLQRGTREKEELLRQNQARLLHLQALVDKETQRLNEARLHSKNIRGNKIVELEASGRLQQHENNLSQYKDRMKAINSFIDIIKATKTPPVELATLSSRLAELRCELEEVETLVRVDDQRKQRLQDLRNNRPRKSGHLSAEEDGCEDDIEEHLACSSDPLSPLRDTALVPPTATVRRERVSVGGEEHITLRRDNNYRTKDTTNHRNKAVTSAHGISQPHKRRLITSSSEQVFIIHKSPNYCGTFKVKSHKKNITYNLRDLRTDIVTLLIQARVN